MCGDSVQFIVVLAVCVVGVVLWKLCVCQFLSDLRRHCGICFVVCFIACLACLFGFWSSSAFDFFIFVEFAMSVIKCLFHFMLVLATHSDMRPAFNFSLQFNFIAN